MCLLAEVSWVELMATCVSQLLRTVTSASWPLPPGPKVAVLP